MAFQGVVTTGIYCRAGCPGVPKQENVRPFTFPAAAEAAGFRPCLRCRPDTVAGPSSWLAPSELVCRALRLVADGASYRRTVEVDGGVGTIEVRNAPGHLLLRVDVPHVGGLIHVVDHARRVFDLDADPAVIGRALRRDPSLKPLVQARPGLRVP